MNLMRLTAALIAALMVGCASGSQVASAPASYYQAPAAAVTSSNPNYVPVFVPGVITVPQSVYGSTAVTSYEPVVLPAPVYGTVAENGSYYGQPNVNGVPKTVAVGGYYRKDGTYVRGHYRSSPGSNPPSTRRRK
jgi:ABC-type Fe3+-hydroxamate transport system substrate-binding protein